VSGREFPPWVLLTEKMMLEEVANEPRLLDKSGEQTRDQTLKKSV
jgi:hypothetical protein